MTLNYTRDDLYRQVYCTDFVARWLAINGHSADMDAAIDAYLSDPDDPFFPCAESVEAAADDIIWDLSRIVLTVFVSRMDRASMVGLANALYIGSGKDFYNAEPRINVCEGATFSVTEMLRAWNSSHVDESPIEFRAPEVDFP